MTKVYAILALSILALSACGSGGSSGDDGGGGVSSTLSPLPAYKPCTVTVPNGTYLNDIDANSYPAGSVVCAATDGQVEFTGNFRPSGYDMRGFVVNTSNTNKYKELGDGIFERISFVGGPACGNMVNTGANANTIIRDSVFYGEGGRYLLLAYETTGVQIVDVIFRVDGGWGNSSSICSQFEPNAALNLYDTNTSYCYRCIDFDTRVTADSSSETLGGLGINAHTSNMCYTVEINNSVSKNANAFWADGNGSCNTLFSGVQGSVNSNLSGSVTIADSKGPTCNNWEGNNGASTIIIDSDFQNGNCASNATVPNIALNTTFLNDPRWRAEMCGGISNRTDGWCATSLSLSAYISQ